MPSNDNIYKNDIPNQIMVNKLISIRLSNEILEEIDSIVKSQKYTNSQEFIRAATREKIQKEKQTYALIELKKLQESAKGKKIKIASKEELDKLARSL